MEQNRMEKNIKRSIIFSVITICFLLVVFVGSTYALFSDDTETNIVIGSAKVDVDAKVNTNLILSSYGYSETSTSQFPLGGKAEFDNGELMISDMAPGDKIVFDVEITNSSTITVVERIKLVGTSNDQKDLLSQMVVTLTCDNKSETATFVNGEFVYNNAKNDGWAVIEPGNVGSETRVVTVSIELPKSVGNDYQEASCKIVLIVQAYQGNSDELPK